MSLLKGGPGSGNFGHPGYPRGVAPEHHNALAGYGFRLTGGDTSNGTLHVYQDGLGNKALLRTLKGKTTLAFEGPYGLRVAPGDFHGALDEYLMRSNSRSVAARAPVGKGGPGSGNFHHEGRPGQVGGSGEGSEWANPKERLASIKPGEKIKLPPLKTSQGAQTGLSASLDRVNPSGARTYVLHAPDGGVMQRISERDLLRHLSKGGQGSGNFGHHGRPGEVGGSGAGGGGLAEAPDKLAREAAGEKQYPGLNFRVGPPTKEIPQGRNWVDKIPGQPEDTLAKYTRPDGTLDPARKELHDSILASALQRTTAVPDDQKPTAILMMGGTASGKSSVVDVLRGQGNIVVADADDVKTKLPEFQEATRPSLTSRNAAFMVHEESSLVGKNIVTAAIEGRRNLIVDGTGGSSTGVQKYGKTIDRLKAAGYDVKVVMVDLDVNSALTRMQGRAETSGRLVPDRVMRDIYSTAPPNFIPISKKVDSWMLYDNRVPKGTPPRVVWSKTHGKETVHDDTFVQAWKARYP